MLRSLLYENDTSSLVALMHIPVACTTSLGGKAKKQLGWEPKYDLNGLIKDMMKSDVHLMKKESYLKEGGFNTLNYFE